VFPATLRTFRPRKGSSSSRRMTREGPSTSAPGIAVARREPSLLLVSSQTVFQYDR
jgi:hypothetical protein